MANEALLPPEPPAVEIPGGSSRPDLLAFEVDERVRHRIDLEDRLMSATCGMGAQGRRWDTGDLEILQIMVRERLDPGLAPVRRQAVAALGDLVKHGEAGDDAVRHLRELAVSVLEHEAFRIAALSGLPEELGRQLAGQLVQDPSPLVQEWARRVLGEEPERRGVPGFVQADTEHLLGGDGLGDRLHRHHGCCCD